MNPIILITPLQGYVLRSAVFKWVDPAAGIWVYNTHFMFRILHTAAKSLQSCPTLCDPIDGSPPGSPVPGILQARTLEWVAISFSNA